MSEDSVAISNLASEVPFPWQQELWQRLVHQHEQDQLAHAYLLAGDEGLGKSLFAECFARYLLCLQPVAGKACENCTACHLGEGFHHPDVLHLKLEEGKRDISIEQVRNLTEFVVRTSHGGKAKIAIIDGAHNFNISSSNAILKTLEEPSNKTYLFLITELPGRLSATIRSRCQRLLMRTPSLEQSANWLKSKLLDGEDETRLLVAAGCKPLLALRMSEHDILEERHQFARQLNQLLRGNIQPQSVISQAMKLGELPAVGYLSGTSSILIKYLLTNRRPDDSDEEIDSLYADLCTAGALQRSVVFKLLRFYEDTLEARRQLLGGSNPNGQLIMESLIWRWSQLI